MTTIFRSFASPEDNEKFPEGHTTGDRHATTVDRLSLSAGYGPRVANHLRKRLGFCAHKQLAGILDIGIRQAERLLMVDARNNGPTVPQLLALHAHPLVGGHALLAAAFPEQVAADADRQARIARARIDLADLERRTALTRQTLDDLTGHDLTGNNLAGTPRFRLEDGTLETAIAAMVEAVRPDAPPRRWWWPFS